MATSLRASSASIICVLPPRRDKIASDFAACVRASISTAPSRAKFNSTVIEGSEMGMSPIMPNTGPFDHTPKFKLRASPPGQSRLKTEALSPARLTFIPRCIFLSASGSPRGAVRRRSAGGTGCGACGREARTSRTRAAPGLRPPGHYEPAARSSLTEGANAPAKRGPEPVVVSRETKAIAAVERREASVPIARDAGTPRKRSRCVVRRAKGAAPAPGACRRSAPLTSVREGKETTAYPAPQTTRAAKLARATFSTAAVFSPRTSA